MGEAVDGSRVLVRCAEWDMLSPWDVKRKPHPSLEPQSGTRFPLEGCSGTASHFDIGTNPVLRLNSGAHFLGELSK